jgi:membrane fusion protein (multidrug efflux system)
MDTDPPGLPPMPPVQVRPSTPTASRAGVRLALGVTLVALVGLGVFTGVRVKQAMAKRDQVAAARTAAQTSVTKRAPLQTTHPTATTWKPRVEMTGTLKPWREAEVGFETSGRLVKVLVATGDVVRDRQTLAYLDGARAGDTIAIKEASVRAAAANFALAEDGLRRTEALVSSKSLPEAQAEQARQQVALTRAQLQAAQGDAQLARTGAGQNAIFAPFAGVVTRAPTAAGGVVQPGTPLVHIEDLSRLRLSATVGEDDVPLVSVGAEATVRYRDRAVTGKVIALVPSLDQATRRAPVEIEVPNDPRAPLLAWGFVHASLETPLDVAAVRVPPTARRPGSQDEVVKIENGKARIVRVTHAVADDGAWIVRQGLTAADVILTAPTADVKEGDAIAETEMTP